MNKAERDRWRVLVREGFTMLGADSARLLDHCDALEAENERLRREYGATIHGMAMKIKRLEQRLHEAGGPNGPQ